MRLKPCRAAERTTQPTSADIVAKSSVIVPPSDMWCSDMPKGSAGVTSPRHGAGMACAARSATS